MKCPMYRSVALVVFVTGLLAACGGSDLEIYAEHCTQEVGAITTIGCIDLRDKINIRTLHEMKSRVEDKKATIVQQLGEQGYETSLSIIDEQIGTLKDDRPGFFMSFLKGAQRKNWTAAQVALVDMDNANTGLINPPVHWQSIVRLVQQRVGTASQGSTNVSERAAAPTTEQPVAAAPLPQPAQAAASVPAPSAAAPASPTDVTAALYRSYVSSELASPGNDNASEGKDIAWRQQWLTPHFIASFQALIDATDADPIVLAQDECPSWASDISTKLVSMDPDGAIVSVTLGAHTQGWHSLVATLRQVGGKWLLDSVASGGNGPGGC